MTGDHVYTLHNISNRTKCKMQNESYDNDKKKDRKVHKNRSLARGGEKKYIGYLAITGERARVYAEEGKKRAMNDVGRECAACASWRASLRIRAVRDKH